MRYSPAPKAPPRAIPISLMVIAFPSSRCATARRGLWRPRRFHAVAPEQLRRRTTLQLELTPSHTAIEQRPLLNLPSKSRDEHPLTSTETLNVVGWAFIFSFPWREVETSDAGISVEFHPGASRIVAYGGSDQVPFVPGITGQCPNEACSRPSA